MITKDIKDTSFLLTLKFGFFKNFVIRVKWNDEIPLFLIRQEEFCKPRQICQDELLSLNFIYHWR